MKIRNAQVHHLQVPIENPVRTSFGVMDSRHAVFLTIEEQSGLRGIGESWVNFPHWAPWERVIAFERAFIPYLTGRDVPDVPSFVREMARAFRGPALQSGTFGPYLQSLCAVEMALWDLAARVENVPLNQLLFDDPAPSVRVYGSGINSPIPWEIIDQHLDQGVRLFKLKLGFGDGLDLRNLRELKEHLGDSAQIAVDVNRGWTTEQALKWQPALADFDVQWLEEPLRVEDEHELPLLQEQGLIPLAGAENMQVEPGRDLAECANAPLDIYQPDITKYCCLQDAIRMLNAVLARGKKLYPHFLGSAPGQAASLHLASGCGDCLLEWDINPNPLRTDLFQKPFQIQDGMLAIPDRPGIGWEMKCNLRSLG